MAKTRTPTSTTTRPPTTSTTLATRITELVNAAFTGLYIESHEPDEAIRDLTQLARRESWRLGIWDCDSGLSFPCAEVPVPVNPNELSDPLAVLRAAGQVSQGSETTLLVFQNFHRFLGSTEVLQAVQKQVSSGKHTRTFIVILAPVVNLPAEIEKQFMVIEHELPGREQLQEIATGIAQGDELPAGDDLARVLDSAAGLTRYEAEGAFCLSIVRHGKLAPACIWDVKSQQLKKSGLVSIHRGTESFEQLGGLDNLKAFCLRATVPAAFCSCPPRAAANPSSRRRWEMKPAGPLSFSMSARCSARLSARVSPTSGRP
jgi:hypothetical protein